MKLASVLSVFLPFSGGVTTEVVVPTVPGAEWTLGQNRAHWTLDEAFAHWTLDPSRAHWTLDSE